MITTTLTEQTETRVLKFAVSGADAVPVRFHKDNRIIPDQVILKFVRTDFGRWELTKITVEGQKQLKSGKASDNQWSRHDAGFEAGTYYDPSGWGREHPLPGWLRELIDANMPLDGCAIPLPDKHGDLTRPCPAPPVGTRNVHRRADNSYAGVTVGRTVQEPRCADHMHWDHIDSVPFSTI